MPSIPSPVRFASKEHVLRASTLFEGVPAPLVNTFAASSERLVLGRGDVLWTPGDTAAAFHIVAFGAIKLQRVRPESPVILSFFLPGESIADAIVVARDRMPASAVAQSPVVEILRVPAEQVLAASRREPALADALQIAVARQVRWLHTKIEIVTMGSVAERLATFVLRQVERFPKRPTTGSFEIPFAPSRVELASMVDARAETITRALGKLAKEGVFTVGKHTVVVHDLEELRRRVPYADTAPPPKPRERTTISSR